jgi:hypothetical protein
MRHEADMADWVKFKRALHELADAWRRGSDMPVSVPNALDNLIKEHFGD